MGLGRAGSGAFACPPAVGGSRRVGRTAGWVAGWALGAAVGLLGGCTEVDPPRLVALLGCGLEVPEGDPDDASFTSLLVQARGDFPPDDDLELRVDAGVSSLHADPGKIAGVTVEGLLGATVTAVGRTARMQETGDLPVYFAPEDQWCAVTSAVSYRDATAIAVGSRGDVLVVGGRDATGQIVDDVVHLRDDTDVAVTLPNVLPVPSTGHSVHAIGPSSFAVVGGASVNPQALASIVRIDLLETGATVSDPEPIDLPLGLPAGRAYHGAASLSDDRVLVTGGCTGLGLTSECFVSETDVVASSFTLTFDEDTVHAEPAPPLTGPRFGHDLLVARDGVAFVVGGKDAFDSPVQQPERLVLDAEQFEPYGPEGLRAQNDPDASCGDQLSPAPDLGVEGSALLEGGMLVLAFSDGTIRWTTETETGCFRRWCTGGAPCFSRSTPGAGSMRGSVIAAGPRTLLALPGERVLADAFLLPVGGVDLDGDDVDDLSQPTPDNPIPPPGQRTGAGMALLDDGSVLVAAGRDPVSGAPAQPFFVRVRPDLDGPDERIPDIDDLSRGSMVALQPDRVVVDAGELRLRSVGVSGAFPEVRARARGFRSASFRFEVTLHSPDSAEPHIVLEQGALAGIDVRLAPDRVEAIVRDATGSAIEVSCGSAALDFTTPQVMRIDVRPGSIRVRQAGREIARCVGPGEVPVAIAVGVSGVGTVIARQMRLTRI